MIDAYLHAGGPRFGSASLALRELDRHQISSSNIVLPPSCPDFEALQTARELKGNQVRLIGIPFGDSPEQRAELTAWQIKFGINGLRVMPHEVAENRESLALTGEAGRWLFAINPYQNTDMQRILLDWLEKYPKARIVCPHFFKPGRIESFVEDPGLFRTLLEHPRFFVIFSRHGNTGTSTPYPHPDLKPWVEDVIGCCSWDKVMWGSEYPVLYWRDESIPQAADWIRELLPDISTDQYQAFVHGNAQRLFFDEPAPENQGGSPPGWLPKGPHNGWGAPVAQKGIKLPPQTAEKLFASYLDTCGPDASQNFSDFIADWISKRI